MREYTMIVRDCASANNIFAQQTHLCVLNRVAQVLDAGMQLRVLHSQRFRLTALSRHRLRARDKGLRLLMMRWYKCCSCTGNVGPCSWRSATCAASEC